MDPFFDDGERRRPTVSDFLLQMLGGALAYFILNALFG